MKLLIVFVVLVVAFVIGLPQRQWVHVCEKKACVLPSCQCSEISWQYPGIKPQFVVLSFDDSISKASYDEYIKPTFVGRKNPDSCPISGTFFVPHEYTNYSVVNTLFGHGFEIGSHSVTKNYSQEYWRNATEETLIAEFAGQRTILYNFAKIPYENITGARVPQLQLNGKTFKALHDSGFKYDTSWPTQQPWTFYPYTLDFTSRQNCHTIDCQVESTPGLWEMPIIDWKDQKGVSCNSIQACAVEENIFEWMVDNYNTIKSSGAPISLRLSYSWFLTDKKHGDALNKFLDHLGQQNNTYISSYKQMLEWSENPSKKFSSCQKVDAPVCSSRNCRYTHQGIERELNVCGECPMNYPWINNPTGK